MRISVALPIYNGMPHLRDAVQSILVQDNDVELIISDDGSSDGSLEFVRGLRHSAIRVISNKSNIGIFANLNKCISESSGEYVQVFSQDDLMKSGFIASQAAMLDKYPDAGMVYGMPDYIDADGRLLSPGKEGDGTPEYIDELVYRWIASHWGALPASISSIMVRKSAFNRVGMFDPTYRVAGDIEFYNRVSECFAIIRNEHILHTVRSHDRAASYPMSAGSQYLIEEARLETWYQSRWGEKDFNSIRRFRAMTRGKYHFGWIRRKALEGNMLETFSDLRRLHSLYPVHWIMLGIVRSKLWGKTEIPKVPAPLDRDLSGGPDGTRNVSNASAV